MTNAKVYQGFHDDKKVEEHGCKPPHRSIFNNLWQNEKFSLLSVNTVSEKPVVPKLWYA